MFAYCLNNPVNGADPSGFARNTTDDNNNNGIPDYLEEQWIELTNRCRAILSGVECRDVTDEVNAALEQRFIQDSNMKWYPLNIRATAFFFLVNNKRPWDIKREDPWKKTIDTEYPGSSDTVVIYEGHYYTPEILGNYTYGALGRAYGFDIPLLFAGSIYAAKFPQRGTFDYDNEMVDWLFIANGYYS